MENIILKKEKSNKIEFVIKMDISYFGVMLLEKAMLMDLLLNSFSLLATDIKKDASEENLSKITSVFNDTLGTLIAISKTIKTIFDSIDPKISKKLNQKDWIEVEKTLVYILESELTLNNMLIRLELLEKDFKNNETELVSVLKKFNIEIK